MQRQHAFSISVIGTGNMAWHLIKMFRSFHVTVTEVAGRNSSRVKSLADEFEIEGKPLSSSFVPGGDILFLAVSDTGIPEVISMLTPGSKIVVHCSASTSVDVFKGVCGNYGIFYMYQTFTTGDIINYSDIPVFLEAGDTETLEKLKLLASGISSVIYEADTQKRMLIHIAGIMASNFTNHMYNLAWKILEDNHIHPDILYPLIKSTAAKINKLAPGEAQTGPAMRNDQEILLKHVKLLEKYPDIKDIYLHISRNIAEHSKKGKN